MAQSRRPTDHWQGAQGYQLWESMLAEHCGDFHSEPPQASNIGNFIGAIWPAPASAAASAARIACNCSRIYRDRRDVRRDSHDYFYLVLQLTGGALMEQGGSQCLLQPGDLTLLDSAQPSNFHFSGAFSSTTEQISLVIPRYRLQGDGGARLALNRRIASGSRIGQIAKTMALAFFQESAATAREGDEAFAPIMDALISLLRGALADSAQPRAERPDPQQALFDKASRCIQASLAMPELTPQMLAQELNISKRTLYRLFAQRGLSVSRFILNKRLDNCARQLQSPTHTRCISSVAYGWGFNDVSHFSRAFKSRFGVSPRDFRGHGAGSAG